MIWVVNLSKKIAMFVVRQHNKDVCNVDHKIEGISQEINILRELKAELVKKEKELEQQRLEGCENKLNEDIVINIEEDVVINIEERRIIKEN